MYLSDAESCKEPTSLNENVDISEDVDPDEYLPDFKEKENEY